MSEARLFAAVEVNTDGYGQILSLMTVRVGWRGVPPP